MDRRRRVPRSGGADGGGADNADGGQDIADCGRGRSGGEDGVDQRRRGGAGVDGVSGGDV